MTEPQHVRLSVNINQETADALKDIAARRGESITETIRRATAILKLVEDEVAAGTKVVLDDGHVSREVVLVQP